MTAREICYELAKAIEATSHADPFGSIDLWPYFQRAIDIYRKPLLEFAAHAVAEVRRDGDKTYIVVVVPEDVKNAINDALAEDK